MEINTFFYTLLDAKSELILLLYLAFVNENFEMKTWREIDTFQAPIRPI